MEAELKQRRAIDTILTMLDTVLIPAKLGVRYGIAIEVLQQMKAVVEQAISKKVQEHEAELAAKEAAAQEAEEAASPEAEEEKSE